MGFQVPVPNGYRYLCWLSLGAGVTRNYELPIMGVGNGTGALCKNTSHSKALMALFPNIFYILFLSVFNSESPKDFKMKDEDP